MSVALVTGVGPGTGASLTRALAANGYKVAMLARDADRLETLAAQIENAHAFPVDVSDVAALDAVISQIERSLGDPEIVIHNAVGGAFGSFLQIEPSVLARNFDVNVMALLHLARRVAPRMIERGRGVIIATGNTSALRGKAAFAGFAPTKAAQRILAEAMARELGPQGIHVAYVVIDAVIDVPWTRERFADQPDDFFIHPDDIAREIVHVAGQPRSAWSFNVEVRPYREAW